MFLVRVLSTDELAFEVALLLGRRQVDLDAVEGLRVLVATIRLGVSTGTDLAQLVSLNRDVFFVQQPIAVVVAVAFLMTCVGLLRC